MLPLIWRGWIFTFLIIRMFWLVFLTFNSYSSCFSIVGTCRNKLYLVVCKFIHRFLFSLISLLLIFIIVFIMSFIFIFIFFFIIVVIHLLNVLVDFLNRLIDCVVLLNLFGCFLYHVFFINIFLLLLLYQFILIKLLGCLWIFNLALFGWSFHYFYCLFVFLFNLDGSFGGAQEVSSGTTSFIKK